MRVGSGRPPGGYGKGYVSASELAGMLSDSEPLTRWAVLMSRAGKDPFRHRDEAGEVGDAMHAAIVAYMSGKPHETILWDATDQRAAEHAFHAWRVWWEAEDRGEPLYAEWPLASKRLRMGGTFDLLAMRPCGLWLYDWKGCETHSALTGEPKRSVWKAGHALQAGAYGVLWRDSEHYAQFGAICGATIVYAPRDSGQTVAVDLSGAAWEMAQDDAAALVPLVRRHREREAYDSLARPLPELEPCEADGDLTFGP